MTSRLNRRILVLLFLLTAALSLFLLLPLKVLSQYILFPILAVPLLLMLTSGAIASKPKLNSAAGGFLFGAAAAILWQLIGTVKYSIESTHDFDFLVFWVYGRAVALGLNPYLPQSLAAQTLPFPVSPEYQAEVLDIGSVYPPHILLLVSLIGRLEFLPAYLLWYVVQLTALVGCIYLLWRSFSNERTLADLFVVVCLVIFSRPVWSVIWFAQTGFLVLLGLLGYWARIRGLLAGLCLALSSWIKPWVIPIVLYPLIRRDWRTVLGFALGQVIIFSVAIFFLGSEIFVQYLQADVSNRAPEYLYLQGNNQSLLAWISRRFGVSKVLGSPILHPLFIPVILVMTLLTARAVLQLPEKLDRFGISAFMLLSLLLYPSSLEHYAIVLLPPLLLIWSERDQIFGGRVGAAALITATMAFTSVFNGAITVVAYALLWCFFVFGMGRLYGCESLKQP